MDLFGDEDIIYDDEPPEDDFGGAVSYAAAGESLSLPLLSDLCLGHEVIEKQFLDLYKKDKMPHAVVFSGAQGIGKTTFAFRLARFLLKHSKDSNSTQDALFASDDIVPDIQTMDVPKDDPVFSRIASGGHADLLHINKNESAGSAGNALKVEEVRTIEKFLRKTASEGGYRIVIIEDADMMTRSAQNAILKILEEPPEKVLMILVAHRSGMLIPTIRSRVRLFKFMPLSNEILLELLRKEEHSFTEKEQQRLLLFASGSIGKALSFCGDGGLEMLSEILTHLENTNKTQLHKFSQSLSAKGQEKSSNIDAGGRRPIDLEDAAKKDQQETH